MNILTFDEWHVERYGDRFKNLHQREDDLIHESMILFLERIKEYNYEVFEGYSECHTPVTRESKS